MTEVDRKWELNTFFKMYCGIVSATGYSYSDHGYGSFQGNSKDKERRRRIQTDLTTYQKNLLTAYHGLLYYIEWHGAVNKADNHNFSQLSRSCYGGLKFLESR